MTNVFDQAAHAAKPVVMAPVYGQLPECQVGMVRFLMGRQGLFLDTRMPFGAYRRLLWESPVSMDHCGEIVEIDEFTPLLKGSLLSIVISEMLEPAADAARERKEWAGCIVLRDGEYVYQSVNHSATTVRLQGEYNRNTSGCLVLDVHSHGLLAPEFSGTDDKDDDGGIKIALVIGFSRSLDHYAMRARIAVEGFFFEVDLLCLSEVSNG
jgi:PRTRC genetic system protein A